MITDKDIQKLNRKELLEVLLTISEENDRLTDENKRLKNKRRKNKRRKNKMSGKLSDSAESKNIAESLQLNKILRVTEEASNQYLENIARLNDETQKLFDEMINKTTLECNRMIDEAKNKVNKIKD